MSDLTFTVYLGGSIVLSITDVWPDGGAPENPTDEDVARVMRECGTKMQVLRDWNLEPDVSVGTVDVWDGAA